MTEFDMTPREARLLTSYIREHGQLSSSLLPFWERLNYYANTAEDRPVLYPLPYTKMLSEELNARLIKACSKAVALWGSDLQTLVLMEELAELIRGISKYKRYGDATIPDLIDEVADVQIMLTQLWYVLPPYAWEMLPAHIGKKVDRVLAWIDTKDPKQHKEASP